LLFGAARSGNLEVVRYFITNGLELKVKNSNGETPLFNAVKSGNLEVVKYLVEKGLDVNAKDNSGNTALCYVERNNETTIRYREIREFLINVGGKLEKDIILR
jgi:ankyrin repeat protein